MKLKSVATLQQLTKIKLSLLMWKHHDIQKFIKHSKWKYAYEAKTFPECLEIYEVLKKKLLVLQLPNDCSEDITELLMLPWFEISHWILPNTFWYNMENVFKEHIDIYYKSILWTDLGYIDLRKSLSALFTTDLPILHKFRLACMHCLEENATILWSQLPNHVIEDITNDRGLFSHCPCSFRIIQYWTFHIIGAVDHLVDKLQLQNEQQLYCFILECIVNSQEENFFALQYFWQLLNDENKRVHILLVAKTILQNNHCKSICYIVSEMSHEQLTNFLNKEFVTLWKRNLFVPFAVCIATCYNDSNALSSALADLSERPFLLLKGKMVFIGVWREKTSIPRVSSYVNDVWLNRMFQHVIHQYSNWCFSVEVELELLKGEIALVVRENIALILLNSTNVRRDIERVNDFLRWCFPSSEEICGFKEIAIASSLGVHMGSQTIVDGDIEKYDTILKWCFSSQDKVYDFKEYSIGLYMAQQKENISLEVVNSRSIKTVETLDKVLNWCLMSPERIISFKESSITHELRQSLVLQIVNSKNVDDDIQRIEFILNWLFSTDEKVKYFKSHTIVGELKNTIIFQIINADNFKNDIKRIDTILNWSFLNEDEIVDFKENHVAFHIKNKIVRLMKGMGDENDIKKIDAILNWCFSTSVKTSEFKERVITNQLKHDFGFQLMNSNNLSMDFKVVDTVLNWCFSSEAKVVDFKETVMALHLQEKIGSLINSENTDDLNKVDVILKWCFSTQEGIDKFKDSCNAPQVKDHCPIGPELKKQKVVTKDSSESDDI